MRRLFLAVALALAVAAVTAGTSAASHQESGSGGPNDFAVGSFTTQFPDFSSMSTQKFRFSAHSGPAGEDPRGYVVTSIPTPSRPEGSIELKGHVTCLSVGTALHGDTLIESAAIEAELDEPILVQFPEEDPEGPRTLLISHVGIIADDMGLQGNDAPKDPVFVDYLVAPSGPPSCVGGGFRWVGEDHGNVTIHNAAP